MRIGIIGLGYVGLPLFLELDKKFLVHGYDHDQNRVKELKHGIDRNSLYQRLVLGQIKNLSQVKLRILKTVIFLL